MTKSMQNIFDLIHRKQAEALLEMLEKGGLTASEFNAVNKFLTANAVTGIRGENEAVTKLSEGLAAFELSDYTTGFVQ